jgi:putative restriction endonuclease
MSLYDTVVLESTLTAPAGAAARLEVREFEGLHRLLRRAFQLSRTLPYELLNEFQGRTAFLPRGTEAERLVVQRLGQDIYRQGLIEYWEGRCAITGLNVVELLRASHSKPWAECIDDAERLDVFNGFLLAPHLDVLFDRGFITIVDDGSVLVSSELPGHAALQLGLITPMFVSRVTDGHRKYLAWHRVYVFKGSQVDAD